MTDLQARALARFAADWESALRGDRDEPPRLDGYLPDGDEIRLAVLTDLIREDLRRRRSRPGLVKRVSRYRTEFPELAGSAGYPDLVCEEYQARSRQRPMDLDHFTTEYPEVAAEIRRRFTGTPPAPPLALPEGIEAGRRLDDFDLLTELGGSAAGRMFLARQRSMQRLVAVRVERDAGGDTGAVAQLDHPYIVRVFDQRHIADAADRPLRLLYMQYLPGGTAGDVLNRLRAELATRAAEQDRAATGAAPPRRGPGSGTTRHPGAPARAGAATRIDGTLLLRAIDAAMEARGESRPAGSRVRAQIAAMSWPETVAWIGRRLAEALDHAARQGVSHCDIRPGNVLFTAEGIPKLADFAAGQECYTATGGNGPASAPKEYAALRYRAPEALAALIDPAAPAPDGRSDIYSLGLLLWEMLTGTVPFDDPSPQPSSPTATVTPGGGAGTDSAPSRNGRTGPGDRTVAGIPGAETVAALLGPRRAGVPESSCAALPSDTPAALRRVLLECLDPDPGRRWQDGRQLAGQLDLCLDTRARDLVDPPPDTWRSRLRSWPVPIAALCVGLPNALASWYNIRINQSLIVDRLSELDQHRFEQVGLINNAVAFPLVAALLLWWGRRPLTVSYRLARGHWYTPARLARARADTLLMGERAVWAPFTMWMIAGVAWPLALVALGADLPPNAFPHFLIAQVVCAAIALAYPFFLLMVYAVRALYPQLLARGTVGPEDRRQLSALARRASVYLVTAALVPLLGVASATFVPVTELGLVIVPLRWLSMGAVLAFVLTYWLYRLLVGDLHALARAIPEGPGAAP